MIKIENVLTFSDDELKATIRGMRNPMNSWDLSDDGGVKDISLMRNLVGAGTDHSKFMRMLPVYMDITAPLYWWKEFDTYKVGTVTNSCSTMHKIHANKFTRMDFSFEYVIGTEENNYADWVIGVLNKNRDKYLETKDKKYWFNMIQLLPSAYNQKRTVYLNYAVLRKMYFARKNHKLPEWREFCKFLETLPLSELITMEE